MRRGAIAAAAAAAVGGGDRDGLVAVEVVAVVVRGHL